MDFSLFDDKHATPQQTTTGITSTTSYSPPNSPDPNRPLSSSQMIRSAQSGYLQTQPTGTPSWALPTPTENAVREECKPGIVKTAKARSAWQRENRTRALAAPTTDPENFGEEFPAVSKLANSMTTGRVRSSVGRPKKENWLLHFYLRLRTEGSTPMFMATKMARLTMLRHDSGLVNFSGCALTKTTKQMLLQEPEK